MSKKTPTPLFIFSLPRSGSTLLQRVLAAHSDVATASESHILLPYLYTLRERGVYSEYNHQFTVIGIRDFCLELPNGQDDYLAEIRTLILRLYKMAAKREVRYFLDKAGAYHLIAEDLIRLFPEGKFIFLWRNPLSVVASLMQSWRRGHWNLFQHDRHLFQGVLDLVSTYEAHKDRVCAFRYESFLEDPEGELRNVFDYLDLSFDPAVVSTFADVQLKGSTGDQVGMKQYSALSQEPVEKWKQTLTNPIRKMWCRRYLRFLGKERLAVMGYDMDVMLAEIDAVPTDLRFLGSDLVRVPYGVMFRLLEGRMVKHKLQDVLKRQRLYMHG